MTLVSRDIPILKELEKKSWDSQSAEEARTAGFHSAGDYLLFASAETCSYRRSDYALHDFLRGVCRIPPLQCRMAGLSDLCYDATLILRI